MDATVTTPAWIGPPGRPLLTWVSEPSGGAGADSVVVAPPIGYEYSSSHRALRVLAEQLAACGHRVLRLDYDGTGDSAGDQWDPGRLAAWVSSVGAAVVALRAGGSRSVTVVGVQLGATVAALHALAAGAGQGRVDRMVLWEPVVSGRSLARGLRLLGLEVPPSVPAGEGSLVRAGTVFAAETLEELRAVDLARLDRTPAPHLLVIGGGAPAASWVRRLQDQGATAEHAETPGGEAALAQPAEYATVPAAVMERIVGWVGPGDPGAAALQPLGTAGPATVVHQGATLQEEVVRMGPHGLVGVLTTSSGRTGPTVVWLNAGSEPHTGPGRAWVEYGRAVAGAGGASLRVDFSGWGESPDRDRAPGRPYDPHCVTDALEVVAALHAAGHRRVVLAGVCAGAWVALRAALAGSVDGVVAINPQLYWQPGDPVEADLAAETRVRREDEIAWFEWGADTGLWSALDRLGCRHRASEWLDALGERATPVLAAFADGDDGLQFLQHRTAGAWAAALACGTAEPVVELTVLADLDHAMHRQWARPALVAALLEWLDRRVRG